MALKGGGVKLVKAFAGVALGAALLAAQQEDPPFRLASNVRTETDLVYARAGGRELKLDLYRPKSAGGVFPGLVFIHGGAWMKGKKTMLRRQAAHMASLGFVAACIEYRLSGEAKFPAALQDAKAAVRWMRANALHYQIDARRIGAVGGSAGGHLAALLGTTQGMKEFEGDGGNAGFPSDVRAVVAFNGVFNLTKMAGSDDSGRGTEAVLAFMGSSYESASERWKAASPVMQVGPKSAPFLLLHGTADNTVPYAQAVEMLDRLKASGVAVELYTADDAKHGFFNSPPYYEPTLKKMEEFFIRTLAVLTR